jgi:putative transposase
MNTYKRHRFPPDIISYAVWLYYRFNLSHRDIEDLLSERGITVSREAIRLWCIKFGASLARVLNKHTEVTEALLSVLVRKAGRAWPPYY